MTSDDELWAAVREAHAMTQRARHAFIHQTTDRVAVLERALASRDDRLVALHYLLDVDSQDTRRALFGPLVRIVAGCERWFEWAQQIILEMDRAWVVEHIDAIVAESVADWEGHSAVMWLYSGLDHGLHAKHRARCATHPDPDIRSLAED